MAQLFGRTKATITWYDPQPSSTAFVLTSKRIQSTRAWYAKPTSILGQARQAASKAAAGKIARPTFYDTVVLAVSHGKSRPSPAEVGLHELIPGVAEGLLAGFIERRLAASATASAATASASPRASTAARAAGAGLGILLED